VQQIHATLKMQSTAPLSFSRYHASQFLEGENHDAYEKRIWREKAHYLPDTGECFIPPMMVKFALISGCAYLGQKVKGRGARPWSKHFEGGVQVYEPVMLGVKKSDLIETVYYCHANGKRGPGTRVARYFPEIPQWKGQAEVVILDTTITEDVFRRAAESCGLYVGFGRFSPRVGGFNGRFRVTGLSWKRVGESAA
jgi:hypothetical protein